MASKGLCWSAVTRDGLTLAEAGEDAHGGKVKALAAKILAKKHTPGWEFASSGPLKACRFFVHEHQHVWSVCCVYMSSVMPELLAKGFIEKLCFLTEPLREDPQWLQGGQLAVQNSFAPTLLQRMEQANSNGKLAMVSAQVSEVKNIMHQNIDVLMENQTKLEDLDEKADLVRSL